MNARIQTLLAKFKETESQHRGMQVIIGNDEIEKFAQLIALECLRIVEKNHEKAMNEYDTDVDYAMCSTRVDIENQFGVKE